MRLKTPRIAPLTDSEMGPDVKEMIAGRFGDAPVFNVFRTLARAPKAYKRFMGWGGYILSKYNDLSERDRELVILRAGYNWKSGYEWAQHKRIGLGCGLTEEEIELVEREFRFQQSIDIKSMRSAQHLKKQTNKYVSGLVTEVEGGWKDKAAR